MQTLQTVEQQIFVHGIDLSRIFGDQCRKSARSDYQSVIAHFFFYASKQIFDQAEIAVNNT